VSAVVARLTGGCFPRTRYPRNRNKLDISRPETFNDCRRWTFGEFGISLLDYSEALPKMENSKNNPLTINLINDAPLYFNLPVRLLIPFIAVTHRFSMAATAK
jgi:hypothetical protein